MMQCPCKKLAFLKDDHLSVQIKQNTIAPTPSSL